MGTVRATLSALGVTLRNALRPPTTAPWPATERPREQRMRASFALLEDEAQVDGEAIREGRCIGCYACERICPSQVITVVQAPKRPSRITGKKRGWIDDFLLDLQACIICELCVQVCPVDAIVMTRAAEPPAMSREALLLTHEKLLANGRGALAWATGTLLMEMQSPKRGAS